MDYRSSKTIVPWVPYFNKIMSYDGGKAQSHCGTVTTDDGSGIVRALEHRLVCRWYDNHRSTSPIQGQHHSFQRCAVPMPSIFFKINSNHKAEKNHPSKIFPGDHREPLPWDERAAPLGFATQHSLSNKLSSEYVDDTCFAHLWRS